MFCSTIIPTVGRASLARTVQSVLDQKSDAEFEVIVVNDSGRPLQEADWQHSPRVRLLHTNRHERSVARNTGAAVAQGRFLHFLDDDDWLLPGALQQIWRIAQGTNARWLYGDSQLVRRSGEQLIQLHHQLAGNSFVQVMAGEWIPLQASWIEATSFYQVGGFNPLMTCTEDIDLLRRVALRGDLAPVEALVVCIEMGTQGSTTDYDAQQTQSRRARELILDEANVFARMQRSAATSYWQGRITRIYLTSALWNIRHKRPFAACTRLAYGLRSLVPSAVHCVDKEYWQAMLRSYDSHTFVEGFAQAGRTLERRTQ